MKDISAYNAQTSVYELICHFTDKIVSGEISTFSELREYAESIPDDRTAREAFIRSFDRIRRMNWGLFSQLSSERYPKLWERLVLVDSMYPFAGNLKRNMTITEIFVGLIDIHGYTQFCEQNRRNLSMLELLDEVLQNDITDISAECGVLSRRCRGDEVILIGASAEDVLDATLHIASYFSRRQILKNEKIDMRRPGYKVILPDLSMSAGIAGGQKYTPLVITQDGDISGGVVNEASRTQSRANKLAPNTNKILITNHVYRSITKGDSIERLSESTGQKLMFFNSGIVEFKGTSILIYDVIFNEKEYFRTEYSEALEKLFDSVAKGQWQKAIMVDLLAAIRAMAKAMPDFSIKSDFARKVITNLGVAEWCDGISDRFAEDDFEWAVNELSALSGVLMMIPQIDPVIAEYAAKGCLQYLEILEIYRSELDSFIAGHTESIFSPSERDTYVKVKQSYEVYERLQTYARRKERQRKQLWYRVIEHKREVLELHIRSEKE